MVENIYTVFSHKNKNKTSSKYALNEHERFHFPVEPEPDPTFSHVILYLLFCPHQNINMYVMENKKLAQSFSPRKSYVRRKESFDVYFFFLFRIPLVFLTGKNIIYFY